MKVVFWGAGKQLQKFLQESPVMKYIQIAAIIDSNPEKWGKSMEQYRIQDPAALESLEFDKIAVSTSLYYDEISAALIRDYHLDQRRVIKPEQLIVPKLFDTGSIVLKGVVRDEVYDFKDLLPDRIITNNKFEAYFFDDKHRPIHKLWHYFEIYDAFLKKYLNRPVKMLEIGVDQGGSLQMWKNYFMDGSEIIGIDIDESCRKYEEDGIHICIGSQEDAEFLQSVVDEYGPFDIILDDGSHVVNHQITTFEQLFPTLLDGGIYMCEDVHTSYWREYGGGLYKPDTFIEYSKDMVDEINYGNIKDGEASRLSQFQGMMKAIHYYDSIIVIEKEKKGLYFVSHSGDQKG